MGIAAMAVWEKAATRSSRVATGATRQTSAGVDVETFHLLSSIG